MARENLDFISVARGGMDPFRSLDAFVRRLGERILALAVWQATGVKLLDSQSGMWVIRTRCLEAILPVSGGMSFSQEIKTIALTQKGLRARELSVPFPNNARAGKSKLRLWHDGLDNLKQALLLGRRLRERQT